MPHRIIDNIAQTLLHVGERVVRVSMERQVTDVWDSSDSALADNQAYKGKLIADIENDTLISQCAAFIDESIDTGKDTRTECLSIRHNIPASYAVRILHIIADNDALFVVFERLENKVYTLLEDKWKMALDAAGDGMWDMNLATKEIYFSDKWHELFGYSIDDIKSTDDWATKIHSEDLAHAQQCMDLYLAGKASNYSSEVRYKCKDGSYKWILSRGIVVSKTPGGIPHRIIGTHTDIHKRKLAEEAHYSTLQLLSNLIDNLQDGILVVDGQPKVLFANQAYCDIYDVTIPPNELRGMPLSESVATRKALVKNPEAFTQRIEEIHEAREAVLNDEIELLNGRIYSRDYLPITLANEEKGEIWKFRDITDQKLAQRRFEEQRLFYERILNSIPEDLAVHDAQHRYLFLNPSAIKDTELRKWLIGKHHEDYFRFRNLPLNLADVRNERFAIVMKEKKPYEWVEKIVNKEGKLSYHLRILFPLFDDKGDIDLVIVSGANITQQVLAEQELKKSRDTFANAFNYSGVGMALLSREGKWLEVNQAICDITGYTKEELLQMTFQDITYPADLDADIEQVGKLLQGETTTYTLEKRYISKYNKIVWVSLTVSFVNDSEDTDGFFVSQIVDITAKKKLLDEVQSKNTELEATKISLVNKINQMDELTHIIAHNLRGPAGNIKMLSDKDYLDDDDGEEGKDMVLEMIHQSSIALMDSLNTLMEMALIKLNNEMAFDECNITDIVNNIISQLHGVMYEKHADIKLELEVVRLSYPKVYLESILYNFISNALKYATKEKKPEIIVSTYMQDGRICLSVKDNGIGIDMDKYGDQVFKLNQVFHEGYDSKGVGLFITKTQIESLGGSIKLKSVLNEGTEFIVKF